MVAKHKIPSFDVFLGPAPYNDDIVLVSRFSDLLALKKLAEVRKVVTEYDEMDRFPPPSVKHDSEIYSGVDEIYIHIVLDRDDFELCWAEAKKIINPQINRAG